MFDEKSAPSKKQKLKVIVVTNQFYPDTGGIQRFSEGLTNFLSENYSSVNLCVLTNQYKPQNEKSDYTVYSILMPISRIKNSFIYIITNSILLLKLVIRLNPDLLLSANYYPTSILLALPRIVCRKRSIVYTHGGEFMEKKGIVRYFTLLLDRSINLLIYNSAYSKKIAERNGIFSNIQQTKVIHPVFPSSHLSKINRITTQTLNDSDTIIITTVCRIIRKKGIDRVLEALTNLKLSNVVYNVIGDGDPKYLEELKSMANKYNLANVFFKGKIVDPELHYEYVKSDIFIMTTRVEDRTQIAESFGIVYLEALAAGNIVIISSDSGGAELIRYFPQNVIIVNSESQESIRQALTEAINRVKNRKTRMNCSRYLDEYLNTISRQWKDALLTR